MTIEAPQPDYDIVIVGAGIVGLTLACHLMEQGLRIALLNKDDFEKNLISELRVIAVTLGSQQLLEELNVWCRLDIRQCAPFRHMQVWEFGQEAKLCFDSADIGQASLGYIVKNVDLQRALYMQAKTSNELTWLSSETLAGLQIEKNQVLLTLVSGLEITANLVVGADGDQSKVRQLADMHINSTDYAQRALIARVRTERAHEQTARQIFLPNGPLAFLPLADSHHCSIVWSNTPEEVQRLETLDDERFCTELTHAFEQRLGQIELTTPRLSFALKIQEVDQYIKPNVVLMGDAAHTIHPLAGQGANLGMADAQCLAKVIIEAKLKHRSLSAIHTLRRYERERRFHNRLMGGTVDGIKYLFATNNPMLQKTRQFGLNVLNKVTCLKNYIAHYAMGRPSV